MVTKNVTFGKKRMKIKRKKIKKIDTHDLKKKAYAKLNQPKKFNWLENIHQNKELCIKLDSDIKDTWACEGAQLENFLNFQTNLLQSKSDKNSVTDHISKRNKMNSIVNFSVKITF